MKNEVRVGNGREPASDSKPVSPTETLVEDIKGEQGSRSVGASPQITPEVKKESSTSGEAAHPLESVFRRVGGMRDGMLVCGGIVYILGRLVWAYHASRFNLGNVSVDQSQYFVAGFAPTLMIGLAMLGTYGIRSFLQMLAALFVPDASRRRRILGRIVTLFYGATGLASLVLWIGGHRIALSPVWQTVLLFTSLCAFMAGLPLFWHVRSNRAAAKVQFEYTDWATAATYPVLVGLVCVCAYGAVVYPRLSQEYGGALPRVAYLDIERAKVSPETLRNLVPSAALKSKDPVARTVLLDVFFANSEKVLVKPYRKWPDNRTYEIAAGSVLSRDWVDPNRFTP